MQNLLLHALFDLGTKFCPLAKLFFVGSYFLVTCFCGILIGLCILVVHLGIVEVLIAVKKQQHLVLMAEAEHPL